VVDGTIVADNVLVVGDEERDGARLDFCDLDFELD